MRHGAYECPQYMLSWRNKKKHQYFSGEKSILFHAIYQFSSHSLIKKNKMTQIDGQIFRFFNFHIKIKSEKKICF